MPLIGWTKECGCEPDFAHPNGSGKKVPCVSLDHYFLKCPNPPYPRTLMGAVYSDVNRERYGRKEWVPSASQITACPVETSFKVNCDYVEGVLDRRHMLRGTFCHEALLPRLEPFDDWLIETPMGMTLEYGDGLIIEVHGTMDCYQKSTKTIFDLKTQQEYALEKKGGMSDAELKKDKWVQDNMRQVQVYKLMAEESENLPVEKLELQYLDGGMRFRILEVPIVPSDRVRAGLMKKVRELYEAVENPTLSHFPEPKYKSVNVFPINKSPIKYLYKEYLDAYNSRQPSS